MIVWMENPKHGRMPCYNPLEIENNKKNGWKECGPPPWDEPILQTVTENPVMETIQRIEEETEKVPVERIKRKYTRRIKE